MEQRFSVLGLFFSILVSTENSTAVSNNALSHKPVIMDNDYSVINLKTIFLNRKMSDFDSNIHNSNSTKELNLLDASQMNYVVPISKSLKGTKLKHFPQNTRFPRQADSIKSHENGKEDTAERYIKILLDLQHENEEDFYEDYDNQKYYPNNQEKHHVSRLKDDWNLNKEIENNSKLLTRNLTESQERKRCTKNNMENLSPKKLQLSQPLTSENIENIEDGKNLNLDLVKLRNSHNRNSGLRKKNDDYFINVLNRLIEKLNKSKDLKSSHSKDLLARKNNEPISLENKSVEEKTTNSSSEEELILRLEKIKGNRVIDKLNSSPETTFVNGKWIKNKIQENKKNDYKPVDLRSEFNFTDEPILTSDLQRFNLSNPENQVVDTKEGIPDNLNNLQVLNTLENKEISTSPLPEENEHFLVSRATIKPKYSTSTLEDKLDSIMVDESDTFKLTTNHKDEFNNEDNNKSQDKSYESTLNSFHTTPSYEPDKDLSKNLNNALKTNNLERILEPNVNENSITPKTNYSEEVTTAEDISLVEKENDSLENNGYCNCNKKTVKNILSSTMIQNVTEIKTDSYVPPKNLKMNSNKRSDKLQKTNINSKNITNNGVLNKNKKDLVSNLLIKKRVTNEKPTVRKLHEPKVNTLQKSTLDLDDKTNRNIKTETNKVFQSHITPKSKTQHLLLNGQKKRNSEERNSRVTGIKKNTYFIPKSLQNKNPRQFVVPSKQLVPKNVDYARSNIESYNNFDDNAGNQRVSILSKSLNEIPTKINGRIPSRSLPGSFKENAQHESSPRMFPESMITKLKHEVPTILKEQNEPRNSGGYYDADDMTTAKKPSYSPKRLLQTQKKINNKSSPTLAPKRLEKVHDGDVDVTKSKPGKSTTESRKYARFDQRKSANDDWPRDGEIVNSSDVAHSRKPSESFGNNDPGETNSWPRYSHDGVERVYSADAPSDSGGHDAGPNDKAVSPPGARPTKNDENGPTSKSKKPSTAAKFGLAPRAASARTPTTASSRPFSRKPNTASNRPPTGSLVARRADTAKDGGSRDDAAHAPYRPEDLEPIVFGRPTDDRRGPIDEGPGSVRSGLGPDGGYYDDDDDDDEHAAADRGGHFARDGPEERRTGGFGVLRHVRVDDGAFKIPLVGRTGFDANGSAYISDVYVPVEKPDGRRAALSLAELLTGDFRLADGHGGDGGGGGGGRPPAAVERASPPPPPSADPTGADRLAVSKPLGDNKRPAAPVHVIQIINNGRCPDDAAAGKPECGVSSRKLRNGRDQRVSSAAGPGDDGRRMNRKLANAYDHFDSDILDRFLQVYAPPTV